MYNLEQLKPIPFSSLGRATSGEFHLSKEAPFCARRSRFDVIRTESFSASLQHLLIIGW